MKGRFVTTLLAILFFAGSCFSQIFSPNLTSGTSSKIPSLNSVSGVVIGSDGAPIADARIELRNENTGQTVASGYTNARGQFEFANLPSAQYELVATSGLSEAHERVGLEGPIGLKIRLHNSNQAAAQADGKATVSVAEYKVPQKAREAYHKAQAALSKNKPEDTAKYLAKALEIFPDYAPALTLRGVLSLDRSDPNAAMNDFDKAIHSDPGFALAYTAMTAALNQLRKFDEALRSADRALTLAPQSWQTYFEMAKAYVGKADYPHALQQLTRAQSLNQADYAPIHLVRAHVMLAMKDYSNAMNELQAFLALAPQDPNSSAARNALEKVKALAASSANQPMVHSAR
ncbi:MAG TPA: carboxypeptidase regulatory-like domain-containing protein [Terriglobales bacterium]|nr:carboxypeptidase regulatory-like domain-containing protein [Terriglobales bacterium]